MDIDFSLNLKTILPELDARLVEGVTLRAKLVKQPNLSYETVVLPLARFHHALGCFWSPVSHLNSVQNTPELRKVYDAGVVKLTEYQVALAQDADLFAAYNALATAADFKTWPEARRRVVENALRDFKLAGVALSADKKKQFQDLQTQLSQLTTEFEHHLMDAIDAWTYHTENVQQLEGLPEVLLGAAREKAKSQGKTGYSLGIDAPTYVTVISHAKDRSLREHFYKAYVTRASEVGDPKFDNSAIMVDILRLRCEEAKLLGFDNFTTVSLATKMAKHADEVLGFLRDLAMRSKAQAKAELQAIHAFAKSEGISFELAAYDLAYYSERMKEQLFGFSDEALRQYFPLSQVLQTLFDLLKRLFGLSFKFKTVPVWGESVQFVEVYDEKGALRGGIYMDFFARAGKRSGAWMDEARGRFMAEGVHDLPLAYLTCNFLKAESGKESCLLHDDVVTLFHEMGHVLQHVLTLVDEPDVAGISGIPWDAVELPSQFLENFAWQEAVLEQFGIPAERIKQLRGSQTFQGGLHMLRQVEFALFDFLLHQGLPPHNAAAIQVLLNKVRQEVAVVMPPEYNRFQHSFSHIFAGGYAAGYYSYKWAEVLSADAFSRFEAEGLFSKEVGKAFCKTILESGGSRDPMDLFIEFRGRKPTVDALLRLSGIEAV